MRKGLLSSGLVASAPISRVKRRFVSHAKKLISSQRAKELDYSNFIDKGYLKHENEKQYNKVLADSTSMTEDLPAFALDLYNLYLHNLESKDPIKLQK